MLAVPEPGRGVVQNKHSTDARALSPPRDSMSSHPEVSHAPMSVRVVVLNDPGGGRHPSGGGGRDRGARGGAAGARRTPGAGASGVPPEGAASGAARGPAGRAQPESTVSTSSTNLSIMNVVS